MRQGITEQDLRDIERSAASYSGENMTFVDAKLALRICVELRRLWAIETAAKEYQDKLRGMLCAARTAMDEHVEDEEEAYYEGLLAASWNEENKVLCRLLGSDGDQEGINSATKTIEQLERDIVEASKKMRRHDEASYEAYKRGDQEAADQCRHEYYKAWLELRLAVDMLNLCERKKI